MRARFNSRCPGCGGRIRKGSAITKAGRRYVCGSCAEPDHCTCRGDGPACRYCAKLHQSDYERGDTSPGARASHYDRTGAYAQDGTFLGRMGGRCEDAPCCGCCS